MSPAGGGAASPLPAPASGVRRAELRAADAVGALMELWGFKRQLGRVWTILFLSEHPLGAAEACERLGISTGLLSMSLAELRAWGAVRNVSVPGERRERYAAEVDVWRMVQRVLGTRERLALDRALAAFQESLAELRASMVDADPEVRAAARFRAERLERLVALTRGAVGLLGALLQSARVDLSPLKALSDAIAGRRRT
jgi:DNA-binding transcriptional regulator GbsR (MarR family)